MARSAEDAAKAKALDYLMRLFRYGKGRLFDVPEPEINHGLRHGLEDACKEIAAIRAAKRNQEE